MPSLPEVPVAVLLDCSDTTLRGIALSAENQAANLRKQKKEIEEELVQWEGRAQLAWWMASKRAELIAGILRTEDSQYPLDFGDSERSQARKNVGVRDRLIRTEERRVA